MVVYISLCLVEFLLDTVTLICLFISVMEFDPSVFLTLFSNQRSIGTLKGMGSTQGVCFSNGKKRSKGSGKDIVSSLSHKKERHINIVIEEPTLSF